MITDLLVVLALVLVNGVFSGAEIAILSVRKTRLVELAEAGSRSARSVLQLRQAPDNLLATIQIGITVIGASAAAFGGTSVTGPLADLLGRIPGLDGLADRLAFVAVVGGISYLSLVLGELVPKSLAMRIGESYALAVGPPLGALSRALAPAVWALTGSSNLVLRVFGDRTTFSEARLSRDEIQQLVEEASVAGSVDAHVGEIASRALDLATLDAHAVMVPRRAIVMVAHDIAPEAFAAIAADRGHARYPVHGEDPADVIGYVTTREALAGIVARGNAWTLRDFVHPIAFIPSSTAAATLLRTMQRERNHLALVFDEMGTLLGLITLEDLIEEIVGDILDEKERPAPGIEPEPGGSWKVDGQTPIHELTRAIGVDVPDGDYSTVAGYVLWLAQRIPRTGDRVEGPELLFEIVEASARRVRFVRVRLVPPSS